MTNRILQAALSMIGSLGWTLDDVRAFLKESQGWSDEELDKEFSHINLRDYQVRPEGDVAGIPPVEDAYFWQTEEKAIGSGVKTPMQEASGVGVQFELNQARRRALKKAMGLPTEKKS